MKLPRQHSDDSTSAPASSADEPAAADKDTKLPKGYTPPKGRATPKRREQEIKAGVRRDPNAMTRAQAAERRKQLKKSMSKEEWKEYKRKEREENREQNRKYQERLNAGDEKYLPIQDQGPERRYVRDWVDSRRTLGSFMMPAAAILLLVMVIGLAVPAISPYTAILGMIFILLMLLEGIMTGTGANRAVRRKFPESTATGFGLGFYAFSRSTQIRRWRTPRPQVELGAKV